MPHERIISDGLTFDDVLLQPRYVDFPREAADLRTTVAPGIVLSLPLISSPMDTVTEDAMAVAMARVGGMGVVHRNLSVDLQREIVRGVKAQSGDGPASVDAQGRLLVAAAVGVGADLDERIQALIGAGVDMLVVDSGHGHSSVIIEAVQRIKKASSSMPVMAGNVATGEGAKALIDAGADSIRVGMGPGSICTTRIVTGMGVPQLTALLNVADVCTKAGVSFVADGGVRQMGDMAKALATGAAAVMLGSMLAGFEESPGETVTIDGKQYKAYRGMGSVDAMQKGGAARYGQSAQTERKKLVAEGVEGLVPYKGEVADFLYQAGGSLRSSFYYLGSKTLSAFHEHARFVRITPASMRESHPHTIAVTDGGGNYSL